MNSKIEILKNTYTNALEKNKNKLIKLREKVQASDEDELEDLNISINDTLFNISVLESNLGNIREPSEEDARERVALFRGYKEKIDEAIPDDVPMVFHGNKTIGLVEEIMRSGGLFTPEERGAGFRTFATQVDVAFKKDIHTPLEFAESGLDFVLPYGAIFAMMPKEEEKEMVLKTRGSEVSGGIDSINFMKEPDRLVAIITTKENIERLKKVALEVGIDEDKVVTHEEFLDKCKEKYKGNSI